MGAGNHNVFMLFLLTTLTGITFAFLTTIWSLDEINLEIIKEGMFFKIFGHLFHPEALYYSSAAIILVITFFFFFPVLALTLVQIRNFTTRQTTF